MRAQEAPERRPEDDHQPLREALRAGHVDAQGTADGAVHAVRADQKARPHDHARVRPDVAQRRPNAVAQRLDADGLPAAPDADDPPRRE